MQNYKLNGKRDSQDALESITLTRSIYLNDLDQDQRKSLYNRCLSEESSFFGGINMTYTLSGKTYTAVDLAIDEVNKTLTIGFNYSDNKTLSVVITSEGEMTYSFIEGGGGGKTQYNIKNMTDEERAELYKGLQTQEINITNSEIVFQTVGEGASYLFSGMWIGYTHDPEFYFIYRDGKNAKITLHSDGTYTFAYADNVYTVNGLTGNVTLKTVQGNALTGESGDITIFKTLSQEEYDALETKDPNIMYCII